MIAYYSIHEDKTTNKAGGRDVSQEDGEISRLSGLMRHILENIFQLRPFKNTRESKDGKK